MIQQNATIFLLGRRKNIWTGSSPEVDLRWTRSHSTCPSATNNSRQAKTLTKLVLRHRVLVNAALESPAQPLLPPHRKPINFGESACDFFPVPGLPWTASCGYAYSATRDHFLPVPGAHRHGPATNQGISVVVTNIDGPSRRLLAACHPSASGCGDGRHRVHFRPAQNDG